MKFLPTPHPPPLPARRKKNSPENLNQGNQKWLILLYWCLVYLQSFPKCLRQNFFFMWNSALMQKFNWFFSQDFYWYCTSTTTRTCRLRTNNHAPFLLWWKENLLNNQKGSNIMNMVVTFYINPILFPSHLILVNFSFI